MFSRERVFECSFVQGGKASTFAVRAWDERQARVQFLAELELLGLAAPKEVSVQALPRPKARRTPRG